VKNSVVTLEGTVDSRKAKRMAEDALEHISGVKDVLNHLRVRQDNTETDWSPKTTESSDTDFQRRERIRKQTESRSKSNGESNIN
jgi:hypothetical protein